MIDQHRKVTMNQPKKNKKIFIQEWSKEINSDNKCYCKVGGMITIWEIKDQYWFDWNMGAPILFSPHLSMKGNSTKPRPRLEINIEDKID